jgi:hypothetical protein
MYQRRVFLHRGRVGDLGRFVPFGGGFVFGRGDGIVAGGRWLAVSRWLVIGAGRGRRRYHDRRLLYL